MKRYNETGAWGCVYFSVKADLTQQAKFIT